MNTILELFILLTEQLIFLKLHLNQLTVALGCSEAEELENLCCFDFLVEIDIRANGDELFVASLRMCAFVLARFI